MASTGHAGIDDTTEGELEYDIAKSETLLRRFHEVDTAQTRLCQRMLVREVEDRHQRELSVAIGSKAYPELVDVVTPRKRWHQ